MLNAKKLNKLNQDGTMNPLVIPLIISVVLIIVSSVLAVMYYSKFIEQRDANQPTIDSAVATAEILQKGKLEAEFTEREKVPTKNFITPSELGSVNLQFPKTWSSYVIKGSGTLEYYGHPNYVPSKDVNYALRASVVDKDFAAELRTYDALVKKGELKATAVKASGVTGTRLDGFLKKDQEGSIVLFPLRDKVLKVWTESKDFRGDFDNIVLKNLTFIP